MLFVKVCVYVSDRLCKGILLRPVCVMLTGTTPAAAAPVAANSAENSSSLMIQLAVYTVQTVWDLSAIRALKIKDLEI